MKSIIIVLFSTFCFFSSSAQKKESTPEKGAGEKSQVVEAACGQCKLGLKGNGCDLAVRIDGKAYYVDGTQIDDHGDAHASDGFCNAIRKAEVKGKVENDRFKAIAFQLVKEESKNKN